MTKKKPPVKRPAKRKPKPKPEPNLPETKIRVKKSAAVEPTMVPTVSINVDIPGGRPSMAWLRETAAYIFTTSLQRVTLADLSEHPLFKGNVSLSGLEEWSKNGGWVEMRRQNAEAWRKALVVETGKELIAFRRSQLKKLRQISAVMFDKLIPDKDGKLQLTMNSYESMAQAFVRVFSLAEELTQKSLDEVMPDVRNVQDATATVDQSESVLRSNMTLEDARIGAKAILAYRREQQRQLSAKAAETPKAEEA